LTKVINENIGCGLVSFSGAPIPIAPALNDSAIRNVIGDLPSTPLEAGIGETMQRFIELRDAGRLDTSDIEAEMGAAQERTV
jgi:hypothetical protein